ncbi:hypothetical protein M378DRAFT_169625 [Amanita muscaria Koide BX008]|uniref:C2H2-type domain-containing protein n=1 Tax=Amanita muscaria (strain Koide BX008) TaxID=946122 RepID=A0A0C2WD07_AMAMK|nr:hypothetical protein M378DRAFT_169625 [Amanita muscaria Koide BX008]
MSFGCEKCSKTFVQKSAMTRHMKRCSNQMIYQCTVEGCRKIFSQSSQLRAHENVHTKKKPYACGIGDCPAKFGDPSSKARHVKEIHRTTHVNVCPVAGCSTRIKRNSAYNAHLKRKHGITDVKANLRLRQPVLQSPPGPPSNDNKIESLSNAYTIDERDSATPLIWQPSIPQTLASLQAEPNDISVYSRTRLLGDIPEVPLVIDPQFPHWGSDIYARAFRVDGSSCLPPDSNAANDTMSLCSNYGFHDDLFSNYDIYSTHRRSTMGSSVSSNSWHYGAYYHMFSDTNSESAPHSVYSSDLASLGLRSPTVPVLSLPC